MASIFTRHVPSFATLMLCAAGCSGYGTIVEPIEDMEPGADMPAEMSIPSPAPDMERDATPDLPASMPDMPVVMPSLPVPGEVQAAPGENGIALSWLPAKGALRYEVRVNGGAWQSTGSEMAYLDEQAPGGSVTAAQVSASDMTERAHVALEVSQIEGEDGPEQRYEVRAIHEDGASMPSEAVTARRPFAVASVQWERQDRDDATQWETLSDATLASSVDPDASPEGEVETYRVAITPVAGEVFVSQEDEGQRLAAVQLSIGFSHACALLNNGEVKCWGDNGFHQLGLSHGDSIVTNPAAYPLKSALLPEPVDSISCGLLTTCAKTSQGKLYCWGTSPFDQNVIEKAPNGTIEEVELSTLVKTIPQRHNSSFCYINNADHVRCFGSNIHGQLGYENKTPLPIADSNDVNLGQFIPQTIHMNLAPYYEVCITTQNNELVCWGANLWIGMISENVGGSPGDMPPSPVYTPSDMSVPLQISLGTTLNLCFIQENVANSCWGLGDNGLLGNRDTQPASPPGVFPSIAVTGTRLKQLFVGASNVCLLDDNAQLYCWGKGTTGINGNGSTENLGDDSTDKLSSPISLPGAVTATFVGTESACAIVQGDVFCWGKNTYGILGNINIPINTVIGDEPGEMPPKPVQLW